tara:strand:- start:6143 stop:6343 length:201 start_codon:yes stop_codon:yes gene_type:complete
MAGLQAGPDGAWDSLGSTLERQGGSIKELHALRPEKGAVQQMQAGVAVPSEKFQITGAATCVIRAQ